MRPMAMEWDLFAHEARTCFILKIKQTNLMDHVHNANGNYGIVNFTLKPLLGTYCHHARKVLKSSSVHHLGCDVQETRRYPYATEVSGAPPHERPQSAFASNLKTTP